MRLGLNHAHSPQGTKIMPRPPTEDDYAWVANTELEYLEQERSALKYTNRQQADIIMEEALPAAATRLAHIAKYHPDSNVAMKAINAIMDRTMGRPRVSQEISFNSSPQESLHSAMMQELEAMLNLPS